MKKAEIRQALVELGKEVADHHTPTKFPEWALLKIGINEVYGIPFDRTYWEDRIKPMTTSTESQS